MAVPDARILELSDVHFRAEPGAAVCERDPDARLGAVLVAWRGFARGVDLVLLTGDQTDDGSRSACVRLREALASLDAPIVAVLGNHDDEAAHRGVFDTSTVVEIGGWRVVGCNTARPGQVHGELDVDALTETIDGLDRRPTLLHLHHPPVPPTDHPWSRLTGSAALLDELARRPHIRAVLSGHTHSPLAVLPPRGPALLGCPSTLVAFRHRGEEIAVEPLGAVGARYLELERDGGVRTELLLA